jgi:hypothetical protein
MRTNRSRLSELIILFVYTNISLISRYQPILNYLIVP